jgi:hypothetical protein
MEGTMRGRAFGFGFGPAEWWWWAGRGGRRRQWFESGDLKYVILKLLRDKPMHGYEVMKALEEQTHGCYRPSPGSVYPTLQWLTFSEERWGPRPWSDCGGRRRVGRL